ncbi:Aspartate carbamoyltransferase catalytic subunit [archaeon HR06]|nr:Aspartate carbamoyltransferase catalytic subunit [archaeon HR06]
MSNPFYNKDVVSIKDFTKEDLLYLFKVTDKLQEMNLSELRKLAEGKILGYLFFEPSTRTRISFEVAMNLLGGSSVGFSEPKGTSLEKGENLADTLKVMEGYCDLILLRHPKDGSARFAAEIVDKPVINGGSGSEEHPTQAMLDLYTIQKLKGKIDDLNLGIIGDLKYGRTVYSLLYGLSLFKPKVYLISPQELRIRREVFYDLSEKISIEEFNHLEDVIEILDVIYVTRIQKERFPDPQDYEKVKGSYTIDNRILSKSKEDLIILHPLPRVDEIKREVDNSPKAKYFLQSKLGKYIRAALIVSLLRDEKLI